MASPNNLPIWIQAGAAVAQAILAFVLWRATSKYVELTADLVATNQQQLNEVRNSRVHARHGQLVRLRQLAEQVRTLLAAFPDRLEGSGVDRSMRNLPLWDTEPRELVQLAANLLPVAPYAHEVATNIDWIADRVRDVRKTTVEQGFRYERIDRLEWQTRRDRVLKALAGIENVAVHLLDVLELPEAEIER